MSDYLPKPPYHSEIACRVCASVALETIIRFGPSPIADRLLEPDQSDDAEPRAPLSVALCTDCGLVQILETVDPDWLFGTHYPYFSSASDSWLRHCRASALELIATLELNAHSKVMELASNDGYMLHNFVQAGIPVLGIEPAVAPAERALSRGIPTRVEFFDETCAEQLVSEGERYDLVLANNVLAHVADLHGFVRGVVRLLRPGGVLVAEMAYAGDLLSLGSFDTIYHQHLCYFALTPLIRLFDRYGLRIFDVRHLDTQGGSLRIFAARDRSVTASVDRLVDEEQRRGVLKPDPWRSMASGIERCKAALVDLLDGVKQRDSRVVAYGAAAKGTMLLHHCGIGSDLVDYVVDVNEFKQGKRLPGSGLEICSPQRLADDKPDFLLLLSWNLRPEIAHQQRPFLDRGGRIIVPLPEPRILDEGT